MTRFRLLLGAAMAAATFASTAYLIHAPSRNGRLPLGTDAAPRSVATDRLCETMEFGGTGYTLCRISLARNDVRIMLRDAAGVPYGGFTRLSDALASRGETLLLAMNAGMYHEDRSPVGLHVEDGETLSLVNTGEAPGNFFMKPNGVFWIAGGRAHVEEAGAFLAAGRNVGEATQSGPMLLVGGALHPRFIEGSDSRNVRNGVAATDDGRTVLVAISREPVNFHDFALFFRDALGCGNALYFDGSVSSLFVPDEGIREERDRLGPMLVVTPKP